MVLSCSPNILVGAPASGGSTLCKKAMNDPRLSPMHYVSVDDLLRGMLSGDEVVPTLKAHMICLPYVSAESRSKPKIVLLDGFPQSLEEAEAARRELRSPLSIEFPDLAIYFSCPKNVLKNRYVAKGEGLYDGSLFEKRFKQHEMECPAVVERYREIGSLVEVS